MHARKSSDTAILIARSILLSSREPTLSKLVATGEEEALRCIAAAHVEGGWFAFAEKRPRVRKLLLVAERFLLGGIFAHYLARKRWIERELREAIAEGIRQVIVVGAGYDALAWRLHREFPRVSFVEIDHPATQVRKLAAMGMPANLHLLPADLSRDLPSHVLSRSGSFVPGEASVVIAEGLTMYSGNRGLRNCSVHLPRLQVKEAR